MLLVGIGLFGALTVGQFDLRTQFSHASSLERTVKLTELAGVNAKMVNELQKERGLSTGFVSAKGGQLEAELRAQRLKTDIAVAKFKDALAVTLGPEVGDAFIEMAELLLSYLGSLEEARAGVDSLEFTTQDVIGTYTETIRTAISESASFATGVSDGELTEALLSLSALLWAKDYAGLERAYGTAILANPAETSDKIKRQLRTISSQDDFLNYFVNFATDEIKEELRIEKDSAATKEVEALRLITMSEDPDVRATLAPADWFEAITRKIDEWGVIESHVLEHILERANTIQHQTWMDFYSHGLILVSVVVATLIASAVVYAQLTGPLARVLVPLNALADGDLNVEIPEHRNNEFGQLSQALAKFKENAVQREQMEIKAGEKQAALNFATSRMARALGVLAQGDLRAHVQEEFDPELEQLRTDLNETIRKLDETISAIIPKASKVGKMATDLNVSAEDLARRTENQAATLEETAAALERVSESVKLSAENAEETDKITQKAQSSARSSSEVVSEAVRSMERLEDSSKQISSITSVIDDIAFQTNLLALNAGVEAARAGDAGSGFAVVASEVRALALRSAEAAKEINSLINQSNAQVVEGVTHVRQTGLTLEEIVEQIDQISKLMQETSSSTKEQASALHEINIGVTEMDKVTQRNAAMVDDSKEASFQMTDELRALQSLISQFKITASSADQGLALKQAS